MDFDRLFNRQGSAEASPQLKAERVAGGYLPHGKMKEMLADLPPGTRLVTVPELVERLCRAELCLAWKTGAITDKQFYGCVAKDDSTTVLADFAGNGARVAETKTGVYVVDTGKAEPPPAGAIMGGMTYIARACSVVLAWKTSQVTTEQACNLLNASPQALEQIHADLVGIAKDGLEFLQKNPQ